MRFWIRRGEDNGAAGGGAPAVRCGQGTARGPLVLRARDCPRSAEGKGLPAVRAAYLVLLVICGCSTVTVIPADKEARYLAAGTAYVAPAGGMWLVPPARMQDILRKLNQE